MANALGENLEGRYVVLRESAVAPRYHNIKYRVFLVTGGFGASSFTAGSALFGESPFDGEKWRADGHDVDRYATDEEIALVTTELKKEESDDPARH